MAVMIRNGDDDDDDGDDADGDSDGDGDDDSYVMVMMVIGMVIVMVMVMIVFVRTPIYVAHYVPQSVLTLPHGPHGPHKMPPQLTSVPVRVVPSCWATSTSPVLTLTLPVSNGKVKTSPWLMLLVFVAMGMRTA